VYGRPITRRLAKKIQSRVEHLLYVDFLFDSCSQTSTQCRVWFHFGIFLMHERLMPKIHYQQIYQFRVVLFVRLLIILYI
jgi:hypothetical protein